MRISDWSSDVCSSDLHLPCAVADDGHGRRGDRAARTGRPLAHHGLRLWPGLSLCPPAQCRGFPCVSRSEEHTSELQSLMRISYAVFCLKKKKYNTKQNRIDKQLYKSKNNATHKTRKHRT